MNELVRFVSRAILWQAVGRLMRGRSGLTVALLAAVAGVAFLLTTR